MYIHRSEKGSAADNGAARIFEHADPPARCIRLFLPINPSGLGDGHATVANDRGVYDAFRGEPHRSARACGAFDRSAHAIFIGRLSYVTRILTRRSFCGRLFCIRDFRARILMDGFCDWKTTVLHARLYCSNENSDGFRIDSVTIRSLE